MTTNLRGVFRNYRFLIAALTAVMLILLLHSSSNRLSAAPAVPPIAGDKPAKLAPSKGKPVAGDGASNSGHDSKPALKTPKCGKDHKYVVMIDAGSTGSRVHVYEFDVCTEPPILVGEKFKMRKPGLSSFNDDPVGAAKSLDELLDYATSVVPKDKRNCSPVAVKATAGLRKLGDEKSSRILEAVRKHLEQDYEFPVVDEGVSIMSGADEGVYAWITTNYLLGNIGTAEKQQTAAVFDLGGGSTQIVFEPEFPSKDIQMEEGDHKYNLNFGGHQYTLYQFSHPEFGQMEARRKVNEHILKTAISSGTVKAGETAKTHTLVSPCFPPDVKTKPETVVFGENKYTVIFEGPIEPAPAECRFLTDDILRKSATCTVPPCSFNGAYQPSLIRNFNRHGDLYVFSYFYDRTHPIGLPPSFELRDLLELTRLVCMGKPVWKSVFSAIEDAEAQLEKEPHWCMDLNYQVSLLNTGYDIPFYRDFKTAAKIAENELGWCLGASLPLLTSDTWKCKISEQ
ncbi:FAFR362Cp [Eremothecium gossypii FDAG1]|nr:FAFR362Cp [Eremothecium gossypii FDAG1]